MTTYIAKFDRIGRKHDIKPLAVTGTEREIEDQVLRYARPNLGSRDVAVMADIQGGHGVILVGGVRNAGTFTLEPAVDPVTEQGRKRFADLSEMADDPEWLGI